jgi:hypothetical protein
MTDLLNLTVRLATTNDQDALERLAALDSGAPLDGPALLAEARDVAVAAVSLTDGRVIADPFERTEDAVAVLRLRARHFADWVRPRPARGRRVLARLTLGAAG